MELCWGSACDPSDQLVMGNNDDRVPSKIRTLGSGVSAEPGLRVEHVAWVGHQHRVAVADVEREAFVVLIGLRPR